MRKSSEVPVSLSRLEQRFAAWREKRVAGQRFPESLWNSAVAMAMQHGVSRTASLLKLDYNALKKRKRPVGACGSTLHKKTRTSLRRPPSDRLSLDAERTHPKSLPRRFDHHPHFLGYSLPLWAPDGKTWRTVYLDAEFRVHWSDGWEHIWHWKDQGIFRVVHHGPATYGACTFFLNF